MCSVLILWVVLELLLPVAAWGQSDAVLADNPNVVLPALPESLESIEVGPVERDRVHFGGLMTPNVLSKKILALDAIEAIRLYEGPSVRE